MSNSQCQVGAADPDGGSDGPVARVPDGAGARRREIDREQAYVTALYQRLDVLRERTRAQLAEVLRQGSAGTHQARSERDSLASTYSDRFGQLSAVEHGLCFGRLDRSDGSRFYVGRVGLSDEEHDTLLVDWRAPVARPFYSATPAAPEGVVLRRHIHTRGRSVVGVDDDPLDLSALDPEARATLNGEAALLASLVSGRTGRMADIVATIQIEQDRIIRSDLSGILVVQGGPGTGKTVVALHRVAYLLYTHRRQLARRGVLVIGPNPTFLRYIDQVLPALGETEVLLSTVDRLYPGVEATGTEPAKVAAVKGDLRMAGVLRAAVRDLQRLPDGRTLVRVNGEELVLGRRTCQAARTRARRSGRPHNQARAVFARHLVTALARQAGPAVRGGDGELAELAAAVGSSRSADVAEELADEPAVRAALDALWPRLSAERFLAELYASDERMAAAGLTEDERALLRRAPDEPWTPADVALLDEVADLLGELPEDQDEGSDDEQHAAEVAYARHVLDVLDLDDFMAVDPELLAAQYRGQAARASAAERAESDRTWTFGHVIVDEAQELSPMAWRMLMRRCPSRSMTVVGDLAQRGSNGGTADAVDWADLLDPHAAGHWRLERLTLNYRTPAEIMAVAADVLASIDPTGEPPTSVRTGGAAPWSARIGPDGLGAELERVLAAAADTAGTAGTLTDGRIAVLAAPERVAEVAEAVAGAVQRLLPEAPPAQDRTSLDAPVVVLSVTEAKGLEFDGVVVVEPAELLAAAPRGGADLYVALTRATSWLGVLHTGELPAVLAGTRPLVRA